MYSVINKCLTVHLLKFRLFEIDVRQWNRAIVQLYVNFVVRVTVLLTLQRISSIPGRLCMMFANVLIVLVMTRNYLKTQESLTSCFLAGLKKSIKSNPTTSFSALAKKRAVCDTTIHRCILYIDKLLQLSKGSSKYLSTLIQNELISVLYVKQLGLKSYAQGKRHLFTTKIEEVCLVRC